MFPLSRTYPQSCSFKEETSIASEKCNSKDRIRAVTTPNPTKHNDNHELYLAQYRCRWTMWFLSRLQVLLSVCRAMIIHLLRGQYTFETCLKRWVNLEKLILNSISWIQLKSVGIYFFVFFLVFSIVVKYVSQLWLKCMQLVMAESVHKHTIQAHSLHLLKEFN